MQENDDQKSHNGGEKQTAVIVDYEGTAIMYVHCENRGQHYTMLKDNPFNFCGYCGRRITYKEVK